MNIKLNYLLAVTALAAISGSGLTSCDSAETIDTTDPALFPDGVSTSLEGVLTDDRFAYTSISSDNPVNAVLTVDTDNVANGFGTVNFNYSKSGDFQFVLEADYDAVANLNSALQTSLASISPNGTRLRELLLRTEAVFTDAELDEIGDIINPLGAELTVDPDNNGRLLAVAQRTYTHEVTSTNRDLAAGVQSGNYRIDDNSFIVSFRTPTRQDLANFRLITGQTKIPEVSSATKEPFVQETGRWVLSLSNN